MAITKTTFRAFCLCLLVLAGIAYAAEPDLIGHWKLDETEGTIAYDSSGNGRHGVLVGGSTFEDVSVPGACGGAVYLNGIDNVVRVGPLGLTVYDANHHQYIQMGIAYSCWLKRDGWQIDWAGIIFTHEITNPYLAVEIWNGMNFYGNYHTLAFHWGNNQLFYGWNSGLFVPDNRWAFVAMVLEPTHFWDYVNWSNASQPVTHMTMYLYDGDKLSFAEGPLTPYLWPIYREVPTIIGGVAYYEDRYYRGAVDDVCIWEWALSYTQLCEYLGLPSHTHHPGPAEDANKINPDTNLFWTPGYAATGPNARQDVYFGTSYDDVLDANSSSGTGVYMGRQDGNTFALDRLELNKTYYWRADDVDANGNVYGGKVWEFTTIPYIPVEDFESYANSTGLQAAWQKAADTGATVTLDTTLYHGPPVRLSPFINWRYETWTAKSMKFSYNNTVSPYYSEVAREWATPQDFTRDSLKALTLYFYGSSTNSAEPMYFVLQDSDGHNAVMPYDGDPNDIKNKSWQEWNIKLADVVGVNLHSISKIYIGFGNRTNPVPGSSGFVNFDDIKLYVSRCVPRFGPLADLNEDCIVDFGDLEVMQNDWLLQDGTRTTLVWYKFDETSGTIAYDKNGLYNATVNTAAAWDPNAGFNEHGCLNFDGSVGLKVPSVLLSRITRAITITLWLRERDQPQPIQDFIIQAPSARNYATVIHCPMPRNLRAGFDSNCILWRAGIDEPTGAFDQVIWKEDPNYPYNWNAGWTFYAFTKDIDATPDPANGVHKMSIFRDGQLIAYTDSVSYPVGPWENLRIGGRMEDDRYKYHGWMDDFRIYDRALTRPQIMSILMSGDGEGSVPPQYCPIPSPANIYNGEPENFRKVNFRDFAIMAGTWLEQKLWP